MLVNLPMLVNLIQKSAGLKVRLGGRWLACFLVVLSSGILPVGLWAQDTSLRNSNQGLVLETPAEALKADVPK